ncbi:hypothetical protein [Pseudonocardia nigra]|uniref:hypothetical protein n=1 Tax=Pseudonocardia nigra TaxID=1921578 RepID=UPI001C601F9D|nr:hypothetical protein [Pseudonocardia nigra]
MVFEIESIDRLYLDLYVPNLQCGRAQVVGFLTRHWGSASQPRRWWRRTVVMMSPSSPVPLPAATPA